MKTSVLFQPSFLRWWLEKYKRILSLLKDLLEWEIGKYSAYSEIGFEIDEVTFGNNVGQIQHKQKMEKIWKAENRS